MCSLLKVREERPQGKEEEEALVREERPQGKEEEEAFLERMCN